MLLSRQTPLPMCSMMTEILRYVHCYVLQIPHKRHTLHSQSSSTCFCVWAYVRVCVCMLVWPLLTTSDIHTCISHVYILCVFPLALKWFCIFVVCFTVFAMFMSYVSLSVPLRQQTESTLWHMNIQTQMCTSSSTSLYGGDMKERYSSDAEEHYWSTTSNSLTEFPLPHGKNIRKKNR